MAIDRAATVKKAESLLGAGKLDAAILEYVRLVEDQPSDWSAGNVLGDLYARAGDKDRAAAQFSQIADSQYEQGFVAKATAFYKKALKVKNGHEHSLSQLAQIATKQELLADARLYLNQLLQRRRDRGDQTGVAECLERLTSLEQRGAAPVTAPPAVAPPIVEAPPPVEAVAPDSVPPPPEPSPVELAPVEPVPTPTLEIERFEGASQGETPSEPPAPPEPPPLPDPPAPAEPPRPESRREEPPRSDPPPQEPPPEPPPASVARRAPREEPPPIDLMALLDAAPERDTPAAVVEPPVVVKIPNVVIASNVPNASNAPSVPNVLPAAPRSANAEAKARFERMLARSLKARPSAPPSTDPPPAGDGGSSDVVAQLEAAARTPSLQFQASAQLGRLFVERGQLQAAVEWFERAVQAPLQVPEHARAVMYEMADALERLGDSPRALAVLTEIETDAGAYRDVRERIDRLTRAQSGGRSA